jgi:hypothetical protein
MCREEGFAGAFTVWKAVGCNPGCGVGPKQASNKTEGDHLEARIDGRGNGRGTRTVPR